MSFYVTGKGFWKLTFRISGRKPPGHNSLVQNPPPVWFCGFYPALPLNGRFWPRGLCPGGYVRSPPHWHHPTMCSSNSHLSSSLHLHCYTTASAFSTTCRNLLNLPFLLVTTVYMSYQAQLQATNSIYSPKFTKYASQLFHINSTTVYMTATQHSATLLQHQWINDRNDCE